MVKDFSNIVLIGMMGTSKTTSGKLLAKRLGLDFIDSDAVIEKSAGKTVNEIFKTRGEPFFRDLESRVIKELSNFSSHVIATGGGVVLREKNMLELSRTSVIIGLTCDDDVIYNRVGKNPNRPLLKNGGLERIKQISKERRHLYEKYSDYTVDTSTLTPQEVVDIIVALVK